MSLSAVLAHCAIEIQSWRVIIVSGQCLIFRRGNVKKLLKFLEQHHDVVRTWWCERCGEVCIVDPEHLSFVCFRRHMLRDSRRCLHSWRCAYRKSMLDGMWFDQVHLLVSTVCRFCCLWLVLPFPRQIILQRELSISSRSVVDWSSFCREVCIYWADKKSQKIGGQGVIVEIDKAKIGKQKYNRGRWIEGNWVFEGFERSSQNCFLVPVLSRGSGVLLDIIKTWIKPGTTIISDCWKAYDCLSKERFVHASVNYSYNFVDPTSGAHTQNIERTWWEVRGVSHVSAVLKNIWLGTWQSFFLSASSPIIVFMSTLFFGLSWPEHTVG